MGTTVLSQPDSLYGAPPLPTYEEAPLPTYEEAPLPGYEADVLPAASVNSAQPDSLYGAPSENIASIDAAPVMVMDASFNFKVDESDHSFQEEADQAGERTGS